MDYRLAINFGLLTASAYVYWTTDDQKKQTSTSSHLPAESEVNPAKFTSNLNRMFETAKKVFKWTKQSIHQISFAVELGIFASNLYSGVRSSKAMERYVMVAGTCVLTYTSWKSPETAQRMPQKIGNFVSSLANESKKIMSSYKLIKTFVGLAKEPKEYLLPMTFAATMIFASHFASVK